MVVSAATRPTLRDVRRSVLSLLGAAGMSAEQWLLVVFVTIGGNLLDLAAAPLLGVDASIFYIVASVLRAAILFWIGYGIIRRMAGVARPWAFQRGFIAFALFTLLLVVLFGALVNAARLILPATLRLEQEWIVILALTGLWGVITIRLLAYQVAFATGTALASIWRGFRRVTLPLVLTYLALLLPFAAVHLAFSVIGLRLPLSGNAAAVLAVIDGLVTAVQLVLGCALSVIAWRLALRGEPREG